MKTAKRIFLCMLALLLPLCGGCMDWTALLPGRNADAPADPDKYRDEFSSRWCYSRLNGRLRTCYGTIYTALTDGFDREDIIHTQDSETPTPGITVLLPERIDRQEAQTLYTAVLYDTPAFFHVRNTYFLSGQTDGGVDTYQSLSFEYTMTASERLTARQQLHAAVQQATQGLPATEDQYIRELHLYNWLLEHCEYDSAAAGEGVADHPQAYTAYGALVDGWAVCEGYARGLQLLLTESGIEGVPVTGYGREERSGHMWNLVRINGAEYYLDATFDDAGDTPRHSFFNTTTQQILLDRTIDDSLFWGEVCTATADNYYVREGTYIDTYQRRVIAAAMAARLRQGDTVVELQFAPDKYANGLLFLKNTTLTLQMLNPLLADTGRQIKSYRLFSVKEQGTLTFQPEYYAVS